MNTPKIDTVAAWTDRSMGWTAELLGRAAGLPGLASMGRNCQLRAAVTLHCAKVKADANKSMRSWKLLDTRLLSESASARTR